MMAWWWGAALAAPLPVLELTDQDRISNDVEIRIASDGSYWLGAEPVPQDKLSPWLAEQIAADPFVRVVIAADLGAPVDGVLSVVQLARDLGVDRTALELRGLDASPDERALPSSEEAEPPPTLKRGRQPQDPYANTNSYSAYTVEWGEVKVGVGSITVGVLPRLQLGTSPALDVLGVPNITAKSNLLRSGRLDGALLAQYYSVPLTDLLWAAGADRFFGDNASGMARGAYLGLGATASVQALDPLSVHGQLYYARPSARGDIAFDSLPELFLPGLSLGGTGTLGLGVSGELAVANLAADLRFNRRDSVYAWVRYPFYGRIRGLTNGSIDGFEAASNADFIVAYSDTIRFVDSASVVLGYQASWNHLEGRVGLGWSGIPGAWILQAFELNYRFGGPTRRQDRQIRRG
jgi:hypothetical protein